MRTQKCFFLEFRDNNLGILSNQTMSILRFSVLYNNKIFSLSVLILYQNENKLERYENVQKYSKSITVSLFFGTFNFNFVIFGHLAYI